MKYEKFFNTDFFAILVCLLATLIVAHLVCSAFALLSIVAYPNPLSFLNAYNNYYWAGAWSTIFWPIFLFKQVTDDHLETIQRVLYYEVVPNNVGGLGVFYEVVLLNPPPEPTQKPFVYGCGQALGVIFWIFFIALVYLSCSTSSDSED